MLFAVVLKWNDNLLNIFCADNTKRRYHQKPSKLFSFFQFWIYCPIKVLLDIRFIENWNWDGEYFIFWHPWRIPFFIWISFVPITFAFAYIQDTLDDTSYRDAFFFSTGEYCWILHVKFMICFEENLQQFSRLQTLHGEKFYLEFPPNFGIKFSKILSITFLKTYCFWFRFGEENLSPSSILIFSSYYLNLSW